MHPSGRPRILGPSLGGPIGFVYRAHADVGEGPSNFVVMVAHAEQFRAPEGKPSAHVIIDYLRVFSARDYPSRELPYQEIEDELTDIVCSFDTLEVLSFDQYGSLLSTSRMRTRLRGRKHRAWVRKVDFTELSVLEMARRLRAAINLGLVHAYRDGFGHDGTSRLEVELKVLSTRNGKVMKPSSGMVRSKDSFDCLAVLVTELLKDVLDRKPVRAQLGGLRLVAGAPGGYGPRRLPALRESTSNSARARLSGFYARRLADREERREDTPPL
jgi:hypothetical protein